MIAPDATPEVRTADTFLRIRGGPGLAMSYGAHVSPPRDGRDWRAAENLVAAIRAMSVEQQAELIGGEVQRSGRTHLGASGLFEHEPVARVVGPWRAEP